MASTRPGLARCLTAASLALCVAAAALWVHSVWYTIDVARHRHPRWWSASSGMGVVAFRSQYSYLPRPLDYEPAGFCAAVYRSVPGHRAPGLLGFSFASYDAVRLEAPPQATPDERLLEVTIPHWFVVACFAVRPIRVGWRRRAQRKRLAANPHTCRQCGYDCRATPGHCPECGAAAHAGP